jgi:hypothetical protein
MDTETHQEAPEMTQTATADLPVLPAAEPAKPAVVAEGEDTPAISETYGLVYAFTLLLYVPCIAALSLFRMYSFSPGYLLAMTAAPVLGMLALMFTEPLTMSPLRTIGSALLLSGLSLTGSLLVIFGGALLLAPVQQWIRVKYFGPLTVIALVYLAALVTPLLVAVVRTARGAGGLRWVRVAVLALALVFVGVILVVTVQPSHPLGSMRTDQASFLIGGLVAYLPGYAISAALWRRFGIA